MGSIDVRMVVKKRIIPKTDYFICNYYILKSRVCYTVVKHIRFRISVKQTPLTENMQNSA